MALISHAVATVESWWPNGGLMAAGHLTDGREYSRQRMDGLGSGPGRYLEARQTPQPGPIKCTGWFCFVF